VPIKSQHAEDLRRPRALRLAAAIVALLLFASAFWAASATADPALPEGFQDEVVFDGLEQPVNFRFAPDGRIFVAEKPGKILVFDGLEDEEPTVFADLRGDVYDNGDRGLLGLVLDPKFDEGRPYVYALYTWDHVLGKSWNPAKPEYGVPGTSGDPDCPTQNNTHSCLVSGRLVRLVENPLNPDHAVEEGGRPKEKELLQGWCQQFNSHSIGELQFGPEEALYVSGGDGASYESIPDYGQLGTPPNPCGDPPTPAGVAPTGEQRQDAQGGALRSQNMKLLNGAILRVDPETGDPLPGNPLKGNGNENTERTIAKGFRNPFRFVVNPLTDEIYSGNVGSSQIEEIDRFRAPPSSLFNSGWPCYEGIQRQFQFAELVKQFGLKVCAAMYAAEPASFSPPLFSYSHEQTVVPEDECPTESGSAISGLSFYEGNQFPSKYKGALFFADAVRGCLWVMYPGADGKPDPSKVERFMREGKIYPGVKVLEGPDGFLYYADLFSAEGAGEGAIHRIAYRPNSPTARLEAEPPYGLYNGSGEFKTTVDAGKSTDPNGDPLTYKWDLNEDGVFESGGGPTKTLTFTKAQQEAREANEESPNRVIAVRVEDDEGLVSIAKVTVYPGDKPPVVTITKPTASERWSVGDLVKLDGKGVIENGGVPTEITSPLPYYWVTRMAHCPDPANPTACHVHPLQTFAGIRRPEFVAPQHDYPSYIEVVLRVSDDRGLSGTARLEFKPRTVSLSLASNPPGIKLLAGSTEALSPFSTLAIDKSEILISAPQTAVVGGNTYNFSGWSDGGARAHPIFVSNSQTGYVATYTVQDGGSGGGTGGSNVGVGPSGGTGNATPPQTILGAHPPKTTRSAVAKFVFRASLGGATFRCKLDAKPTKPCRSPVTYKKLKPGRHTFKVWAAAGVLSDPTPAKFSWKVLPPKR
jgi:glucose/arabinose dehydrogenase